MIRPSFTAMWTKFSVIFGDGKVTSVGKTIGGKVGQNIELGVRNPDQGFTNACAIRMSYALNYSGVPIRAGNWNTVSGGDKKLYIFRVRDLLTFLTQTLGKPDKVVAGPKSTDFAGQRGILVFSVPWGNSSGHATLWDGLTCSDHCYFPMATEASLWVLK